GPGSWRDGLMSLGGWSGWVRYGAPGVALGLGLAWGLGGHGPSARAQGQAPSAIPMPVPSDRPRATPPAVETAGTVVFTSPAGGNAQLLYLIDTRSRAFAVY